MSSPSRLFAMAFREQRLGLMFGILMAILVYLGSLAMAAQAALGRTSFAWGHELTSRLTVEIPVLPDETPSARVEKLEKLKSNLETLPEVMEVHVVPEAEKEALLKSWISDEELLRSLPLPALLDVSLKTGAVLEPEALKGKMTKEFQNVPIYSHADWMAKLQGFLKVLGMLGGVMLALTGLTLVVVVMVICRAVMAVQMTTIDLLHTIGASDRMIAKQFQKHMFRLAAPSALIGFGLAALTLGGLVALLGVMGGVELVAPLSWATMVGVMAFVPLGAVVLSSFAARVFVQRQLRRFL